MNKVKSLTVVCIVIICSMGCVLYNTGYAQTPEKTKKQSLNFNTVTLSKIAEEVVIKTTKVNQEQARKIQETAKIETEKQQEAAIEQEMRSRIDYVEGRGLETYDEESAFNELNRQKHLWIIDQVLKLRARERLVLQINTWLSQRGSPMIGMGECYVQNQERTGISATLSVGIAEAESSSGMACYGGKRSYNAWGMIGVAYRNGMGSWENGIRLNFDYLVRHFGCPQTMHDCPGYCVGNTTMRTVDDVQRCINSLDVGL